MAFSSCHRDSVMTIVGRVSQPLSEISGHNPDVVSPISFRWRDPFSCPPRLSPRATYDGSAINPLLSESRCWRSLKYITASRPRSSSSSPWEYILRGAAKESQDNPSWSVSAEDESSFRVTSLRLSAGRRERRARANVGEKWRGSLSGGRGILTWLVGRDAGSLRGHKARRDLLRDFYTFFETIRTRTDARASRSLHRRFHKSERHSVRSSLVFPSNI